MIDVQKYYTGTGCKSKHVFDRRQKVTYTGVVKIPLQRKVGDMGKQNQKPGEKDLRKIIISFMLSVIDIYLVMSLENWTKEAGCAVVAVFAVTGVAVLSLLIFIFLGQPEKRLKVHSLLWGFPMAAAYVLGCRMRRDGTAAAGVWGIPVLTLQTVCLAVPAAACIAILLPERKGRTGDRLSEQTPQGIHGWFRKISRRMNGIGRKISQQVWRLYQREPGKKNVLGRYSCRQAWALYTGAVFLCWLPVFLAYYPSVFAYDAEGQLYQVIAHDYSTHHPLLHTLFLGAFFLLGGKAFESYQAGMAVHSLVQMVFMAGTFGYTLAYLRRRGVAAYKRMALLLFYGLFPANSILALSTTKDVLFSALVLLCTLTMYQIADFKEDDISCGKEKKYVIYLFWTTLLLLFRNNAVYAFLCTVPVVCLGLRRMKGAGTVWKKYLIGSMAALVLSCAGNAALKAVTDARNGSPREMLSVPLQQMARTRVKAEDTLSGAMRQELDQYLPSEWVFAAYNPYLADPVKNRAVLHDNPAGLVKTWVKLGIEHPGIYVDAFLDNSIGYWFLEDRTHAQIYGIGTESGFGYLSTDNRTMPAGCEIVEHSYLPGLRAFMERIVSDNCYQRIPILRIAFAPAFYWWVLCIYMAIAVYRRRYRLLLPVVFLVFYYMTLLLSPTVLIRYMYPYVVTVPALCCLGSGKVKVHNNH